MTSSLPRLAEVGGQSRGQIERHAPSHASWPGLATARSWRVISTSAGQARASNAGVVAGRGCARPAPPAGRRPSAPRSSVEQLPLAAVVVRAEPHLALDEVGEVAGDADLVLEVRRDGVEDLLVEQPADRREEVRGVRWRTARSER